MIKKYITADQRDLVAKITSMGLNRVAKNSIRKVATVKHTGTGSFLYARNVKKADPENEILVTVACSSYELYGLNSNGDGFPSERAYPELGIGEDDLLPKHYKSFEKASVYSMHNMSVKIGRVHKAFWNDTFKWVELVVEVFANKLDRDTLDRMRSGEMVFFSMGCDVAYDVCTVCGNKSYGDNYCSHIDKRLLDVIDDTVVGMLNPSPDFDDISIVFIPADAIAGSLYRKTAGVAVGNHKNEFVSVVTSKTAGSKCRETAGKLKKVGEIYKNTGVLRSIQKLNDVYSGLNLAIGEGLNMDKLENIFSFFFKNRLPIPVLSLISKFDISKDSFIKAQDAVILKALKSESFRSSLEQAAENLDSGSLDSITEEVNTIEDLDPKAKALAVFNIINKLTLTISGIDSDKLPEGHPEVKDIKSIVQLECIGG